jgi:hypothetical protein
MPDLIHSLQGQDLGHLRIVAGLWGLELRSSEVDGALRELAAAILSQPLAAEVMASLSPEAAAALTTLKRAGGRMPWAGFARQFGDVREIGAAKRDREKPFLHPASAAEGLFYRAFLSRAFFDTDNGPQEFAYIPDDLLPLIRGDPPTDSPAFQMPPGRAATPNERAHPQPANDRILDDATTLLAAMRSGRAAKPDGLLQGLLAEAGILRKNDIQAEKARTFLEASRPEALQTLAKAWRTSEKINELRLMPDLLCEGQWSNDPRIARLYLLNLLEALPAGTWWSLDALISRIMEQQPDFQRPSGDYDSWFIKSARDGRYLRGFSDWEAVDGALIRFLVTGACHRLGIVDLACPAEGRPAAAFRVLASRTDPIRFPGSEPGRVHVSSQGRITVPRLVPRAVRYQLARFCHWDQDKPDEYRYEATPESLRKAAEQGLKVEHLLALLAKHAGARLPAPWVRALKRWEASGVEARAENQIILTVRRPDILAELGKSRAARFLGERIGPTAVVIKRGAQSKVVAALAELGILADDHSSDRKDGAP